VKFVDEYRSEEGVRKAADSIRALVTRPWTLMEICGGQTHTLIKYGLDRMLPDLVTLVHGPGCPVCVTPLELIDRAVAIAGRPDVTFCSFGDMLRVPGSKLDLLSVKARGGDVRMLYSPLDAIRLAEKSPERQVVFFAVGFETTAPAIAGALLTAERLDLANFSVLVSHVLVPPAMEAILSSPACRVQGFLAAGHVCTVMGTHEYDPIAAKYRIPIVVTGFEPLDLMVGIRMTLAALEEGRHGVEIQYSRCVTPGGNLPAQKLLSEVFAPCDRPWRGIGVIPASGYALTPRFARFDAVRRFDVETVTAVEPEVCIAGSILQGLASPRDCAAFGKECTPVKPLGAPMVSSEGACAAYYAYGRE
jgi:hydrogenase expression/formation protein HypD